MKTGQRGKQRENMDTWIIGKGELTKSPGTFLRDGEAEQWCITYMLCEVEVGEEGRHSPKRQLRGES